MMNAAYTLGRILLPIVFIVSGIRKLMDVQGTARMLESYNVPVPDQIVPYLGSLPKFEALGYLVGGVETIAGIMILIGLKARWGALVLVVFTACTIVLVHHFWDMDGSAATENMVQALKNLSILGGLLLIVAVGAGPGAMDQR